MDKSGRLAYFSGGTAIRLKETAKGGNIVGKIIIGEKSYEVTLPRDLSGPHSEIHQMVAGDGPYPFYPIACLRMHAPLFYQGENKFAVRAQDILKHRDRFAVMPVFHWQEDEIGVKFNLLGNTLAIGQKVQTLSLIYNGKTVLNMEVSRKEIKLGSYVFASAQEFWLKLSEMAVEAPEGVRIDRLRLLPKIDPENFWAVTHSLHTLAGRLAEKRGETLLSYARTQTGLLSHPGMQGLLNSLTTPAPKEAPAPTTKVWILPV